MSKRRIFAVSSAALALVVTGSVAAVAASRNHDPIAEQQAEAAYTDAHRDQVAVTQQEAEATALDLHPGAMVESHLEDEGHGLVWEAKPDDGATVWEVQIDSTTGAVISDHPDD